MELRAGTSGFSYDTWSGAFYPEGLPSGERLAYYAARLPAVEINNSFYRMPRRSMLQAWAAAVPDSFRFAVKASRRITHQKRLKEVEEETGYLVGNVRVLGQRLGCLLFQLPPNLKADPGRLEAFLDLLPDDVPAAFEFRHPSWAEAGIFDLLRARRRAWVHVDGADAAEGAGDGRPVRTADWGYLRLRREDYGDDALRGWAARLAETGWREAFVFFKHEDAGAAPRLAARLLEHARAAEPASRPRAARPAARRERA